jgi:hypothetical protein
MNITFCFAGRADGARFAVAGSPSPLIDKTNTRQGSNVVFAGTDTPTL